MESKDWPYDVGLISPARRTDDAFPPAWLDVRAAIEWCANRASTVPFAGLQPETLVLKLAAKVQHAATGANEHCFRTEELPQLFEQIVSQLQDFPAPPNNYRPQINEPALVTDERVRLLVGFSGAGKTAWAAQAALHCAEPVVYFDIGDLPAASATNALSRELVARFLGGHAHGLSGSIFAEKAGIDVLRACAKKLREINLEVCVVIDNAHRMRADSIRTIVEAAPNVRFLCIAQPWSDRAKVEALLGVKAEQLAGWGHDEIAAEFNEQGCPITFGFSERISSLTGGLPLYVKNAAQLTKVAYEGDAEQMCAAVETRSHAELTTQEILLDDTFRSVSGIAQKAAALLSLSHVALGPDETVKLLSVALAGDECGTALRELMHASFLTEFQGNRKALHDALRPLVSAPVEKLDHEVKNKAFEKLFEILALSLRSRRDIPRLNAALRLLPKIGKTDALVDLATREMFYEQGDQETLRTVLEAAANDSSSSAEDQYWANDALAYWESRNGGRSSEDRLKKMQALIDEGDLGKIEKIGLCFKRLGAAGCDGDKLQIERVYKAGKKLADGRSDISRMLRYNYGVALHRAGDYDGVVRELEPLRVR
jgi:hypothetical protein